MALDEATGVVGAWLLTYLLHSTVLLGVAVAATRALGSRRVALQEMLWRVGLVAGIATATLQIAAGWQPLFATAFLGAPASLPGELVPMAAPPGESAAATLPVVAAASPPPLAGGFGLASWLVAGWAAVAALGLGALLGRWLRLRHRLAGRRRVRRGPLWRQLNELRRRFRVRAPVQLSVSRAVAVPVATGLWRPEICLPADGPGDLDAEQQRAILAHELAHLRGRDPLWLWIAHGVERALWLQPLNWVARRLLHDLAEYRCDDHAIAHTGEPVALASCLVEVAGWSAGSAPASDLLPAMASAGSQLESRVHRVLDGATEPAARPRAARALAAALCALALGLPSFRLAPPPSPAADPPAPSLEALVDQVAALAELQRQMTDELAGLRADLAARGETPEWAEVLALLEQCTAALHEECGRLRADVTDTPELPPTDRR